MDAQLFAPCSLLQVSQCQRLARVQSSLLNRAAPFRATIKPINRINGVIIHFEHHPRDRVRPIISAPPFNSHRTMLSVRIIAHGGHRSPKRAAFAAAASCFSPVAAPRSCLAIFLIGTRVLTRRHGALCENVLCVRRECSYVIERLR